MRKSCFSLGSSHVLGEMMLAAVAALRCCVVGTQPLPVARVPGLFIAQRWYLVCLAADPVRGYGAGGGVCTKQMPSFSLRCCDCQETEHGVTGCT